MIKRIQKQIKKVARSSGFKSQSARVTAGLLRDWVILTLNRAWEGGVIQDVQTMVLEVLVTLTRCDLEEEDYDPYDGFNRPSGPLDPGFAGKGLGEAGSVHVPLDIWNKHAPMSLRWALDALPDQGETKDPGLAALAHRMCEDGLIHRDEEGTKSCLKAFAKAKNAEKGALIANLPVLNSPLVKPLPFPLPSLSNLGPCSAYASTWAFLYFSQSLIYQKCTRRVNS